MPNVTVGPFTIPSAAVDKHKDAFLFVHPVPGDENGDPIMAQLAWFNEWLRREMRNELARCKQKYEQANAPYAPDDEDVVQA